jgi:hypothetical protein
MNCWLEVTGKGLYKLLVHAAFIGVRAVSGIFQAMLPAVQNRLYST